MLPSTRPDNLRNMAKSAATEPCHRSSSLRSRLSLSTLRSASSSLLQKDRKGRRYVWGVLYDALVGLLALSMFISALVYGITAYWSADRMILTLTDDFCYRQSVSPLEQKLTIDLRVLGDLSFTDAKLIDIFWDIVVGQGGRFLHAFILYRVVAHSLVWTMEYSAVPYHYYVHLMFNTVSLNSLWSLGTSLMRKRPAVRTVLSTLWLIYAIGYVFCFSAFWSAATGYLSPSTRAYQMPDHSWVAPDSEDLKICWAIDNARVGMDEHHVELGPTLRELGLQRSGESWDDCGPGGPGGFLNVSESFRDIYAYAKTMRDMQRYFNYTHSRQNKYEVSLTLEPTPGVVDLTAAKGSKPGDVNPDSNPTGLYETVTAWQFIADGTSSGGKLALHRGRHPSSCSGLDITPFEETFQLDRSVEPGPGVVPYSSIFHYRGRAIELPAPFLDVGRGCAGHGDYYSELGACVCYRDRPIPSELLRDDNMICISERGYVWGFASFLTLVGLLLEGVWAIGCWLLYLDVKLNSSFVKYRRGGFGVVRTVLDLAGSVNRDLGRKTYTKTDGRLMKKLKECPPIRYVVDKRRDGRYVGIRSQEGKARPAEKSWPASPDGPSGRDASDNV